MNNDNEIKFAFCWFDKEQWELLAKIDPDGVDDSYEQWRKNAVKSILELESRGLSVTKVLIRISELQKWCEEKNVEPNSRSRSEFAAKLAQARG